MFGGCVHPQEDCTCCFFFLFLLMYPYKDWTVLGSNPGGGESFRTRQDRPWDPPSRLYNGYPVFPWGTEAGAWR
jgi:hypothetical protein